MDPVLFLDCGDGTKYLVVPPLEVARARAEARSCNVVMPSQLGLSRLTARSIEAQAVALAGHLGLKKVVVGRFFPMGPARALEKAGVKVEVAKADLYGERAVKSEEEVRHIARTQRAAVAAMKSALALLRASGVNRAGELTWGKRVLTSERLRAVIEHTLLDHDCVARDTIVACGAHAADPHNRGSGPLRAGQTIVIDIFPQHKKTGYWGDITRTVVKGIASDELRRMYRAVREAQTWALAQIREGARADRIHEGVRQKLDESGFETVSDVIPPRGFFHGTGLGVGLEIHEPPSISVKPTVLKAGHVVTVEPGLYYADRGGVRIEDTVCVTERGARILAPCPYPFELR
ncbi:MAG: Xaa-Pro peptidase family protein [Methylocystis sp.]|nr:Xaa-Pro peptidase family protein [Methylocystis sp.]